MNTFSSIGAWILSIFSNREIAIVLWLLFLFLFPLVKINIIQHIKLIIGSSKKLYIVFAVIFAYVACILFLLNRISPINLLLIKVSLVWFFGWGIPLVFNNSKMLNEKNYIKTLVIELVSANALMSFLLDSYSYSLFFELLLFPISVVVALGIVGLKYKKQIEPLIIIKIIALVYLVFVVLLSIVKIFTNVHYFATISTLKEFLLPIVLSISFIPFMYLLALFFRYESARSVNKVMQKNRELMKQRGL